MKHMTVGFIGNPNSGKTTLFNAYTGANLKVANWPGVTVEKVEGAIQDHGLTIHLVDLPGTYSLTSYTMEEVVARNFILSEELDVIINVVDAASMERSLYLTLQLLELGRPVVVALNMMDIVEKRGMEIDLHRLPEMLGAPVIPISARRRKGLDVLLHAAAHHKEGVDIEGCYNCRCECGPVRLDDPFAAYPVTYSQDIEDKIEEIVRALQIRYPDLENYRWHGIKLLEQDNEIMDKYPVEVEIDKRYASEIVNQKYNFIEEILQEVLIHKERQDRLTEKADSVLTHKIWGIPIFLGIMALVFFLTFTVGDWIKGYFELAMGWFSNGAYGVLTALGASDVLVSLLVDGIITGVGTVLTFLPNIAILFLALAFLEDSGYMARVAYVMEGFMSRLGLSGKAVIPMLLGFGCTVPAIMASRSLESRRDRYKVMLVTPFMSCNARLTIYILFSQMFFPNNAMVIAYSMYLIGILVAIIVTAIIQVFDRKHALNYLMIELPEYKMPDLRTVGIFMWGKVKSYLIKAGTTIFLASLILWVMLNFGPTGYTQEMGRSFAAMIGKRLVAVFVPIGLGFWQIAVAMIAGISAKEVVVSSCAVLFGITNASSPLGMERFATALGEIGFGALNAYCLMVFSLLYVPCAATLAAIKKESGSWGWTIFVGLFQIAVAWLVTFMFYRIGLWLI